MILLKSVGEQVRSGSLIIELESEADCEGDEVFLIIDFIKENTNTLALDTLIVPLK